MATLQEYIDHLINKGIITSADVQNIDDNTKNIVVGGYLFQIEKETNGNIKVTHQGKADGKPKIANIQIIEVTPNSIKVKVNVSQLNGGDFTYSIKNITQGETNYTLKASKIAQNEYEFVGLTQSNEYKIEVTVENNKGKDIRETDKAIKAELPEVSGISLDKTVISIQKGNTETLTVTVLPTNAKDTSVTWTSSDTNIVTVDNNGVITAIGEGTATITVSANGGVGVNATCNVVVTPPPPPSVGVGADTHTAKQIPYSWEELNEIAKVISNNYGTEARKVNNNTAEVAVSINGKTDTLGIGDWTTVNGKQVRILGFNHDELTDKTVYGGTNTYAGISFDYWNILTYQQYNSSATNAGGWGACELRSTLNSTTYDSLENKKYIKEVNKQYIEIYNDPNSIKIAQDKLWLLSTCEVWGRKEGAITIEGKQYKYYSEIPSGYKKQAYWALRSSNIKANSMFSYVNNDGTCSYTNAIGQIAITPGFAI